MFQFPDKMMRVFRDENHQNDFEKNGFVILPFYTQEEIEQLRLLYQKLHPVDEKGMFPSTFSQDKHYRHAADTEIKKVGSRSIEKYLMDIKVVFGAFIAKSPGPESGMCVHQDMSLVDESKFTGINIWVPLVDLTVENGALFVLPGSHRLFPTYRASSIPEFFSPIMDDMLDFLQPVLVKAGNAVIFDQSIIHYSPPNYTNQTRVVTNTYFTHKDAVYRTYYWNKETLGGKVEAFDQDDNFMTDFEQFGENIRDRPKVGKSMGLIDYDFPFIDRKFMESRYPVTNARELMQKARFKNESVSLTKSETKSIFERVKELILG